MKPLSYQQWVACIAVIAMVFGMHAPLAVCKCEGCHCPKSMAWYASEPTGENGKCYCLPTDESGFASETPCPCHCCDVQEDDAVDTKAILPIKQAYSNRSGDFVSTLPVNFANVSGLPFRAVDCQTLLHRVPVPIHVLLCVFLN